MYGSGSTPEQRPTEPAPSGSPGRLFLAVALGALVLAAGTIAAGAAFLSLPGQIRIDVEGKGGSAQSVHVRIPAGPVLQLAQLVPSGVFRECSDGVRQGLRSVAAVCRDLERIPDAVLVSVESPDEKVTLAKKDGELVLDADTGDEHVRVSVPIRVLSRVADALE